MDKYEYKVRTEEIKELINQRDFAKAAEIADTIDWRRVKSVMMLCTISDLYKINRRYEDSRDLLLLAYDRHPSGRTIVYALCELAIKTGDLVQAVEYCKEFSAIAPRDPGVYILQYKIYEAQNVSLEERIDVLEKLKKHDYREKWAYELAYLYHRVGLESKCVDECDELIVWFGEGKYVIRAMELKMLHRPLTPEQQAKYNNRFVIAQEEISEELEGQEEIEAETVEAEETQVDATMTWSKEQVTEAINNADMDNAKTKRINVEEIDIQIKTMDPSQCNTINLQEEVAAGLRELLENEAKEEEAHIVFEPMLDTNEFYTDEVTKVVPISQEAEFLEEPVLEVTESVAEEAEEVIVEAVEEPTEENVEAMEVEATADEVLEEIPAETPVVKATETPKEMAKVLSMEGDGQLSFVVPVKEEAVEKQITGQLSIADIMAEWERMKKVLEEKGKEKVRQHVKENTGQMFTEFEASVRDDLLGQLEAGQSSDAVIAKAERMFRDEDDIPVPPSLMEETEDDAVEELAEIVEFPEEAITTEGEEEIGEGVAEYENISEEVYEESEEVYEEASEEVFETSPEEVVEEEIMPEEEELEEVSEELTEEEAEEILEDVEEAKAAMEEEFPEEILEEIAESDEEDSKEVEVEDESEEDMDSESEEEEEVEETESEASEEESATEEETIREEKSNVRALSKEERELFGAYIQGKSSKEQLVHVIDNISMAAYTGNVIITGAEGLDTLGLAKNLVREIQMTDSNFSGKTAKISGEALNKREVESVLAGLHNGALIIQKASDMNDKSVKSLYKALQQESSGIIVIMEGTKKAMNTFLEKYNQLNNCFTARYDMEALSDAALVAFGKKYAKEQEYTIDDFGVLALHRIITDRQTNDHAVTVMEVKEIVDSAIDSANRKTLGHFFDIVLSKRYDEEDMIIIREKDFLG